MHKATIAIAAGALAVAGGTHIAAYSDHLSESTVAAAFFAVVAVLQIVAAMAVLRAVSPRVRSAIVIGNIAVTALWAVSRTTGLPFGPDAGVAEAVGPLDLLAVGAQIVAVAAVVALPRTRHLARRMRPAVALVAVALLVGVGAVRLLPAEHSHEQVEAHHHM